MIQEVIAAIRKHKKFLISAHINPEGDSLCSQLAMKELITALGKEAVMINNDPVPDHYKFLPGISKLSTDLSGKVDFDAALILDCPTLKRIGGVADMIGKDKTVINVDHHISSERFGDVNWVDSDASSTGEMVYKLFKEMDVPLTREIALCLYIAILTDTGSFNYDNTSAITHEIAGDLLGYGLEPGSVSESVYERRTLVDIKLLGLVLSTLKVNRSGEIAYLAITRKMIAETGADISKSEGFVNYARSIDGIKVAAFFKEDAKDANKINVSFRSKSGIDVNKIASFFGGGGHVKASGCVLEGTLADVEAKVVAKIEEALKE
ncbi:MAG: bifunctional oligoribonuclease/PAP phosphatase NrnA [Candidatus Omnitrophica bacterium]|nr:bifunctional oligoribonuclease/PAP phosphatase NrnA [Candidatus Omnitrophota bacterium]MBU1038588.1 bifunctional oligoribonuclease/PAP phosphatase NrnA [Candidatus Omnitrophota bacterium]MBU1808918.1 bifunctional oligoribonuclease/PAP phosphatase NrnA [Candidatus Omnitrophota bacterium]